MIDNISTIQEGKKVLKTQRKGSNHVLYKINVQYIFDSDFVWRMQLMIEKVVCLLSITEFFKKNFKTGFWVQNHLLKFYSSVVTPQRLLCSQKAMVPLVLH